MARRRSGVPEHREYLRGLHGFAAWANRLAFDRIVLAIAGGRILYAPARPTPR